MLFVPKFDLVLIKNTINLKDDTAREALQFRGQPVVSNRKMLILVIQNLKASEREESLTRFDEILNKSNKCF